jgi:hypothetical protein
MAVADMAVDMADMARPRRPHHPWGMGARGGIRRRMSGFRGMGWGLDFTRFPFFLFLFGFYFLSLPFLSNFPVQPKYI